MRDIGPLAAALVLTVLAHLGLPLPAADPLRGTLVVLPLVLVALRSVSRWAEDRGGSPTPAKIVAGELTLLALLTGLTLARSHLGLGPLDLIDRCLVGGFALLLAHRLVWLVRALRPCLGSELSGLSPAPFFVLPFVVYLAILPWTVTQRPPDGDAPHYLLLTHSLAYDFDTDLRNNYEQGDSLAFMGLRLEPQLGDPEGAEGELYSRHNLLLPLILAPFYRVAGLMGVLLIMVAITAATSWLALSLARCYEPRFPAEATLAWAILAFTAPLMLFSYQVWVEIPAGLLVLVGLIQVHRLRRSEPMSLWHWALFCSSILLLPLLKIRFLLIAMPLAALALWQGRRRTRQATGLLLITLVLLVGGKLLFNQLAFDNPLKYHDIDGLRSYSQPLGQYLQGFLGLFFDCAFGLFAAAPVWMLLVPAVFVLARRRHPVLRDFLLVFLPYLVVLSPRGEWFGGWSPPYRYGVVMLPVLVLWLIPLFKERRRTANDWVVALLLVGTLALTTLWLAVPGWTFNFAHGRSHLLDQLSTQVAADVARFFPSSTRARLATYVWPVLTVVVMGLLWRGRRASKALPTGLWGIALAILIPAALVWSAQNRTTHILEFEDPWIGQQEGAVYPDLWVIYRPRYRGGWELYDRSKIPLPVVPGGSLVDLEVEVQLTPDNGGVGTLELADGQGRILARATSEVFGEWTVMRLEEVPWSADGSMTLSFRGSGDPLASAAFSAILDRATLSWR